MLWHFNSPEPAGLATHPGLNHSGLGTGLVPAAPTFLQLTTGEPTGPDPAFPLVLGTFVLQRLFCDSLAFLRPVEDSFATNTETLAIWGQVPTVQLFIGGTPAVPRIVLLGQSSGTFILTGVFSEPLELRTDLRAAYVQGAIDQFYGAGSAIVSGGPLNTAPITITWLGPLATTPPEITVDPSGLDGFDDSPDWYHGLRSLYNAADDSFLGLRWWTWFGVFGGTQAGAPPIYWDRQAPDGGYSPLVGAWMPRREVPTTPDDMPDQVYVAPWWP